MLILLVFLSGLKRLLEGVDMNNWQILGSKLCGFMEHHVKNLTNGNCIFFYCLIMLIQTWTKTAKV